MTKTIVVKETFSSDDAKARKQAIRKIMIRIIQELQEGGGTKEVPPYGA